MCEVDKAHLLEKEECNLGMRGQKGCGAAVSLSLLSPFPFYSISVRRLCHRQETLSFQ